MEGKREGYVGLRSKIENSFFQVADVVLRSSFAVEDVTTVSIRRLSKCSYNRLTCYILTVVINMFEG